MIYARVNDRCEFSTKHDILKWKSFIGLKYTFAKSPIQRQSTAPTIYVVGNCNFAALFVNLLRFCSFRKISARG